MGIKTAIGNAIGIGFIRGKTSKSTPTEIVYIMWDSNNKIAFDNKDILISKQKIKV